MLMSFSFGWTDVNYVDSWVPSVIFLGLVGMSILLLFLSAINYIVDAYLRYANSALAASTLTPSAVAHEDFADRIETDTFLRYVLFSWLHSINLTTV